MIDAAAPIEVSARSVEKRFGPVAALRGVDVDVSGGEALAVLGTDESKPFLEEAPWLIAVFCQTHGLLPDGRKVKHYYALESVGLATGLLSAAVHHAGLASLTHTPSPMGFLNQILGRPSHERPFLLLVVGFPEDDAVVPDIHRKPLAEIASFK